MYAYSKLELPVLELSPVVVEAKVAFRHISVPNQKAVMNPITTVVAMTTMTMMMQAWGLMQGMAVILAVALKYEI